MATIDRLVKSEEATIGIRAYSKTAFARFREETGAVALACQTLDMFQYLDRLRPVVTMDMRGQIIRGTSAAREDVTIGDYVADFENVRKSLKANQLALFGYSPGGFFAAHYAVQMPKRVSALILAEPAIFTEREDLLRRAQLAEGGEGVKAMEAMLTYIDPSMSARTKTSQARAVVKDWQSPTIMANVFRLHAENPVTDKDLRKLKEVPTLLIAGTNSPMNFHVKRIAALVPEAYVWWVKGATHLDLIGPKYAKEVAQVTNAFLEAVA